MSICAAYQNDAAGVIIGADPAGFKVDGQRTLGLLPIGIPAKVIAKRVPCETSPALEIQWVTRLLKGVPQALHHWSWCRLAGSAQEAREGDRS